MGDCLREEHCLLHVIRDSAHVKKLEGVGLASCSETLIMGGEFNVGKTGLVGKFGAEFRKHGFSDVVYSDVSFSSASEEGVIVRVYCGNYLLSIRQPSKRPRDPSLLIK